MRSIYLLTAWALCLGNLLAQSLPPWQAGMLDIHHISTGRGDAAFFVLPDGTTLLVDAGETSDTHPRTRSPRHSQLRPDSSRTASAWIVEYIRQFSPVERLDYAVVTHFHDDHFGEWDETRQVSATGAYHLTGIMAVGDALPIGTLIDRGGHFPLDVYGAEFQARNQADTYHIVQTLADYRQFSAWHQARGMRHDSLRPGARDQIRLQQAPEDYPDFEVRNIAANGRVWTGYADGSYHSLFVAGEYPGENPLSVSLKISYGAFDYFTGGDISGIDGLGGQDFLSLEAHAAPVVGPVDVATLNHHGNRDAQSPWWVRSLRPRVWVQQGWSSDHPGEEVLRRLTSTALYPGPRDLFTTDMLPANEQVIGERIQQAYHNRHGHVVVRVAPGGGSYEVFVLDDFSRERAVRATFGPYISR